MRKTERRIREVYDKAVREHSAALFAFSFRLCGNRDIAEELVQETCYEAWRGLHTLSDERRIRAWLFQILRHRYSHWCRDRALAGAMKQAQGEIVVQHGPQPDHAIRLAEREVIQQALNQLDERFRLPLLMVCVQGMSCREAAEELDLPLGTVLSRLHRARKHLHICLEDQAFEADRCRINKRTPESRAARQGGGA